MAKRRDLTAEDEAPLARLGGGGANVPDPSVDRALVTPDLPDTPLAGPVIDPEGRSSTSPREGPLISKLPHLRQPGPSGPVFSPSPPHAPLPLPRQSSDGTSGAPIASPGPADVRPFAPLPQGQPNMGRPDIGDPRTAALRSLFGSAGGLKEGGLGAPGAPSAAENPDMSQLIAALLGRMRQG